MSRQRSRGGSTITKAAPSPQPHCSCRPTSYGEVCATQRCGCRRAGRPCSSACNCCNTATAPTCACNETCVQRTVRKEGPNRGRLFFTCPHGQCNFFQWSGGGRAPGSARCGNHLTHNPTGRHVTSASSVSEHNNGVSAAATTAAAGTKRRAGAGASTAVSGGKKRSRGGSNGDGGGYRRRNRLKPCPRGTSCPYQHEHQHTSEYSHDANDNTTAMAVRKSQPAFSGKGRRLGSISGGGSRSEPPPRRRQQQQQQQQRQCQPRASVVRAAGQTMKTAGGKKPLSTPDAIILDEDEEEVRNMSVANQLLIICSLFFSLWY